jgi:hypothetical protein
MRVLILLLAALPTWGAIAFDNAASMGSSSLASWTTGTFTVGAGANRILLLALHHNNNQPNYITAASYGGVAMTKIAAAGSAASGQVTLSLWYLAAPASGGNTFTVTSAGGITVDASAISYSGAAQTGIPDNFTTASLGQAGGSITYTINITTNAANCQLVEVIGNGNYSSNTGTIRVTNVANLADRAVTTAGANSISLGSNFNGGTETAAVVVSIAPFVAGAAKVTVIN